MNASNDVNLKCLSLNVRGLNKSFKRRLIFRWLHKQKQQFIFLQECYCTNLCTPQWRNEWGGEVFFSYGTNHSKGVMILINPALNCKIERVISDKNGRFIILKLSVDQQSIVLVNIYAPNDTNQQTAFFSKLNQLLQEFAQENIIIGGDFNCALSPKDKVGGKPVTKKAAVIKSVEALCESYNLRDIWRKQNPEFSRFTWRNKSLKIQCRLDYFLISDEFSNLTKKCDILLAPESDHSAVSIHIQSEALAQKKGPGFWKFNTALLQDEFYVAALRENIPEFITKYSKLVDLTLKWDLIKMEIRGFTVKYSKRKAKALRNRESVLQEKVNDLQAQAEKYPRNKNIILKLQEQKSQLKRIMIQKTKGAILRSKVRWHEQGERNTNYFYGLEKRNYNNKTVTSLKIGENIFTSNQFEILEREKLFYESLYKTKDVNPEKFQNSIFFNSENITTLTDEERTSCEGQVTENECYEAVKNFESRKTPGTDGFPAEFYRFFWTEIGKEMTNSFNYAFQAGTLSISQRRGIISLIPKKNKDKTILENLRPISLLNVDYKILTKTIAKRIEKVLPNIINIDQTGYVKGRYIGENIRLIQDVLHFTDQTKQKGIAIFLDFKKAFDSIEWPYLNAALEHFNFGPDILNWIKIFYKDVSSCVINNGHASTFFPLQRGVRQGCPLSGILFVLGIELFARALKNKSSIKGIEVNGHEIKSAQYADDTTIFVRDRKSVLELLSLLEEFSSLSGLEINTSKTEAMWLGQWKNNQETPFGFKWPKDPILSLGVYFSHNHTDADELNFDAKIRELEKSLQKWQRRRLTLYGKINIAKTLGLSKLIFNASVLYTPHNYIEKINKIIFNFIWDGKPPKIKRKTIISEKKDGGLKMCDFEIMEKALKIAWINRIQNQSHASWKIIPNHLLQCHGGLAFLMNCRYDTKTLKLDNLPDFYRSILEYWQYFKTLSSNEKDIKDEVLWNNCNILIDKKPVFFRNWFSKEIVHLHHLLNEHGKFYTLDEFKTKYNLEVPFTIFYGLIEAIPNAWKSKLKQCRQIESVKQIDKKILSTSSIYSTILNNIFVQPTSQSKILRHNFTENNVHKVYQLPFTITKEVKIIMFQYKIIHNILPTQMSLHRDGISDSDLCSFCKIEKQTINHLLVDCSKTVSFWIIFQDWWYGKTQETLSLNQSQILYGFFEKTSHWQALNYSIILAKYHIFCSNGHQDEPCFQSFLLRLQEKLQILKEIATAKKTLEKYNHRWSVLL